MGFSISIYSTYGFSYLGLTGIPSWWWLNRMDWALRMRTMFWGSGPSLTLDLLHRNSYALFTCSKMSWKSREHISIASILRIIFWFMCEDVLKIQITSQLCNIYIYTPGVWTNCATGLPLTPPRFTLIQLTLPSGFLSGWYFWASLKYAFLILLSSCLKNTRKNNNNWSI